MEIKRLFFDIETSPNIGLFWEAGFKKQIDYHNIIKERAIICICYKWADQKKVEYLTWDSKQSDRSMLAKFVKLANDAEEIIGHNGDRFDLRWIRTRCLFHNIPMPPDFTTIDTLKAARSKFRFNSNRLDYIGSFLGVGKKIKTDFDLWKGILLENDKKKLTKMVKYCQQDVLLLESVFNKLKNHLPAKTHRGVKEGLHKASCPECGSKHTKINSTRITAAGTKRVQRQCLDCGKYHTIRETV